LFDLKSKYKNYILDATNRALLSSARFVGLPLSGWPLNVGGLFAFRPLRDLEGDLFTLFQSFEATHVDSGKVREQIFATVIGRNKPEPLGIVEPFDNACCHLP
jgi:hypothetical protein